MLQRHQCVSVWCDRCAEDLGEGEGPAHFPNQSEALSALSAVGWRLIDTRLLCPECCLAVRCETTGHEFTVWYQPRSCGCHHGPTGHRPAGGVVMVDHNDITGCPVQGENAIAMGLDDLISLPVTVAAVSAALSLDAARGEIGALSYWLAEIVRLAQDADGMTAGPLREEIRRIAEQVQDRDSVRRAIEVTS